MNAIVLQGKIEDLLSSVHLLFPVGSDSRILYVDELSVLNHSIHNQLNELYPQRGKTVEQEATLCLALLMGYSVSIYANPEDESKKHNVLVRSRKLLSSLSSSPVKEQLFTIYQELTESVEINR